MIAALLWSLVGFATGVVVGMNWGLLWHRH